MRRHGRRTVATTVAFLLGAGLLACGVQETGQEASFQIDEATIAGIQAAKRCSDMIPLCHPLMLSKVAVELQPEIDQNRVRITSMCKLNGRTGVEMEALCAASTAALTLYDMCKAVDRGMTITGMRVLEKMGGKSGHWQVESV